MWRKGHGAVYSVQRQGVVRGLHADQSRCQTEGGLSEMRGYRAYRLPQFTALRWGLDTIGYWRLPPMRIGSGAILW